MQKCSVWMSLLLLLLPTAAGAETLYVVDRLELAVRTGQGIEYKILAIAKSNDAVEVMESEGEYSHVRLPNGVEGWVLKRYLTDETPKPIVIEQLKAQVERLTANNSRAREDVASLKDEKGDLANTNRAQAKQIKELEDELEEIKVSCADFIKLRNDYRQLQQQLDDTRQENARLSKDNQQLQQNAYFWGALAGGGFALLWFLIGMAFQQSRSKKRRGISF